MDISYSPSGIPQLLFLLLFLQLFSSSLVDGGSIKKFVGRTMEAAMDASVDKEEVVEEIPKSSESSKTSGDVTVVEDVETIGAAPKLLVLDRNDMEKKRVVKPKQKKTEAQQEAWKLCQQKNQRKRKNTVSKQKEQLEENMAETILLKTQLLLAQKEAELANLQLTRRAKIKPHTKFPEKKEDKKKNNKRIQPESESEGESSSDGDSGEDSGDMSESESEDERPQKKKKSHSKLKHQRQQRAPALSQKPQFTFI